MPKFSIIIPVYNTELYLKKCIESVLNQNYDNYEIIIVNDCSTDNSLKILEKYKNKIKIINNKQNKGQSYSRNIGIKESKGDYILFLDSDDYYERDLLKIVDENLEENLDVLRFQIQYDYNGKKEQLVFNKNIVEFENGIEAFNEIVNYSIIDSPCCYAFNRKYFLKNNYKFKEGYVHEDFGLIPLIILNAKKVKCINFVGYNYVIRENSTMTSNDYSNKLKKAYDLLEHFKYILEECKDINGNLEIFKSYVANSMLSKATTLKGKDYKNYLEELKKYNIYDMLLSDTLSRKIKNKIIKISPKIYFKLIKR